MMVWLGILLLCLIIVACAVLYLILYKACPTCSLGEIAVSAWESLLKEKGMVFTLVATPVLLVFFLILAHGSRNRERLILTETGIEFRSALPGPLNFLHRDWSLQWFEVRRAWIGPMFKFAGGQFTSLFFETGNKRRRILLYPWVDTRHYHPRTLRKEKAYINALQKQQGPEYEAMTTESAVVRYIAEHVRGVEIEPEPTGSTGFALEKNPWTLGVVVLFFLLVAFTMIDGFVLIGETYVTRPIYEVFAFGGLMAAIVSTRLLRARSVPSLESTVLSILLGVGISCALYPGALRLNQWTDNSGLHVHTYQSQGRGRFTPLDESLPELHFDDYPEYWRQFGVGEHQGFELRRGGLGFYQLNMAPIYDAIVEH